jgi:hypothetical protein
MFLRVAVQNVGVVLSLRFSLGAMQGWCRSNTLNLLGCVLGSVSDAPLRNYRYGANFLHSLWLMQEVLVMSNFTHLGMCRFLITALAHLKLGGVTEARHPVVFRSRGGML